jgi:aryl-alcohol dehydrogenase-like predicted oxidoreductase
MDIVRLGKSGLKVSRICLGTMTFGREADEETSHEILDHYIELGGNFIDTADTYSDGGAEDVIGRWLKKRGSRGQVVLTSKAYNSMGPGPNDGGLSRIHLQKAVEASLKRLQTDVIDLYQIHHWDPNCSIEETLEALNDMVRQGKVRYIGASNLTAWQLSKYLHASDRHLWSRFICYQPCYNALSRGIETEILPLCQDEGLGVIVYNPLAGGMLAGKYRRGGPLPTDARLTRQQKYYDRYFTEEAMNIVEPFIEAAQMRGVTPAQLALAWVLAEPRVTCPIVGARNFDQLNDTLGGLQINLTLAEREAIPAIRSGRWVGLDQVYDRMM